uniref:Uncharacterized protein n=1 Tax=Calidris pygmaea TaxID=425635 RepID=A0A8C3JUD0_9CHAR
MKIPINSIVPVSDGRPPSLAVNTNRCTGTVSRSRDFFNTRTSNTLFSCLDFTSKPKCSLGLSV